MEHMNAIDGPPQQRAARRREAAVLRAGLAALSLASLAAACPAAESISGLGSAFRPQAAAARVGGNGERGDAKLPGLRVVVTSPARSVASIDGQIVHVGDVVNGMRVTQITSQGVVLTGEGGAEERMMVNPSVVKHAHPANAKPASNGARP